MFKQLENKLIPLEEWQMQLILAAEHWNSDLDNIKAEMAAELNTYYQLQAEQEINLLAMYEDPTQAYTEMLSLYDPSFCPMDWLKIAAIHGQFGYAADKILALKQFEQSTVCDASMILDIETALDIELRMNAWTLNGEIDDANLLTELQNFQNQAELPWTSALATTALGQVTGNKFAEPLYFENATRSDRTAKQNVDSGSISQELLTVSPNPTSDFVTITIPAGFELLDLRLQIFNSLGALVDELVITQGLTLIDCSEWSNGLYTIRMPVNEQLIMFGKLIKQ